VVVSLNFRTKVCHKLKAIPEVPPQQITDLENTTQQLRQLSHTLANHTISASYEASGAFAAAPHGEGASTSCGGALYT